MIKGIFLKYGVLGFLGSYPVPYLANGRALAFWARLLRKRIPVSFMV